MQTHQILVWAENPSVYKVLVRISAFVFEGEIVGINFKQQTSFRTHLIHIGTGGPVPALLGREWQDAKQSTELDMHKKKVAWEEEYTQHFDVDGQAGEIVTEVHTTRDRKRFKVVTNLGRVGQFGDIGEGEEVGGQWEIVKAEEGELIIGLTACFGRVAGWSEGAKMWSHWCLSGLGVLCMKVGDKDGKGM
jgi:hypothetical protein